MIEPTNEKNHLMNGPDRSHRDTQPTNERRAEQMLGKEPVCPTIFDFDFEKNGGGGLLNGGFVPKKQRVIPSGELKALVLE